MNQLLLPFSVFVISYPVFVIFCFPLSDYPTFKSFGKHSHLKKKWNALVCIFSIKPKPEMECLGYPLGFWAFLVFVISYPFFVIFCSLLSASPNIKAGNFIRTHQKNSLACSQIVKCTKKPWDGFSGSSTSSSSLVLSFYSFISFSERACFWNEANQNKKTLRITRRLKQSKKKKQYLQILLYSFFQFGHIDTKNTQADEQC